MAEAYWRSDSARHLSDKQQLLLHREVERFALFSAAVVCDSIQSASLTGSPGPMNRLLSDSLQQSPYQHYQQVNYFYRRH